MKLKFFLLCIYTAMVFLSCNKSILIKKIVESPDKRILLEFKLKEGKPYYTISFNNEKIIDDSELGFKLIDLSLDSNFKVVDYHCKFTNEVWEQVWGEKKKLINNYNQLTVNLVQQSYDYRLNLVFKVYDDGIGFRYEIPEQKGIDSIFIINELTEFNFAKDYLAWWIRANFDSYEMLYNNNKLSVVESANTPITLENENGICISIHEANLTNYAGMTLLKNKTRTNSLKCNLVPWPNGIKVRAKTPMVTPWRTIQIANSPGGLIESSLILNLNEPNKLTDVSWIQPMKYIGIWWGMHLGVNSWTLGDRHGATTNEMMKYINFASNNNIPAVLAEGWNTGWENWGKKHAFDFVTPYADFDVEEIVNYADSKGIEIIGHHETGGDAEYYEERLDEAFSLYHSLGVNAVKTGYAGAIRPLGQYHHGQYMVNHYRKVVETAAKYHIMINVHEPIKPTGIRRTYPNMMTREGVRGMEWNAWSDGNPPEHHVVLPFTRNLAGPIDYTPGIFDIVYKNAKNRTKWNDQDKGTSRVNTTLAKQLALFVVFYSPMQMASDLIDNYEGHKAFQFIRDVPVDWEDTKVLNAKIGDYLTIVRKDIDSDDWYLGSITDENERKFEVTLDFLSDSMKYIAEIYADTDGTDWKTNPTDILINDKKVDQNTRLAIKLAPGGGQAIRFKAIQKVLEVNN